MPKLELFFYVFAVVILIIIGVSTRFTNDFVDIVSGISGALSLLGVIICAAALLLRRVKIYRNRKVFGDQAEVVERSVADTVIYVAQGIAGLWVLFVVVGILESLKQYL